MASTKIEWAEFTWNPVTGCTKVSEGCAHCYAERMTRRLQGMGVPKYALGFNVVATHEAELETPLRWRKPRVIFVCSMSDLFHPDVPDGFIRRVFDTMTRARWHTFLVLTKRAQRMADMTASGKIRAPQNVWLGVTSENQRRYDERVPLLLRSPATVHFVSMGPLLGPIDMRLPDRAGGDRIAIPDGLAWVIVEGETGPKARPMQPDWVRGIRDQCQQAGIAFMFKQWGRGKKRSDPGYRLLDGQIWDERPPIAGGGSTAATASRSTP